MKMRAARWIVIAVGVAALAAAAWGIRHWLAARPVRFTPPTEVALSEPTVLVQRLPFSDMGDSPGWPFGDMGDSMAWSPDGRYIALTGVTGHLAGGRPVVELILFDGVSGEIVARRRRQDLGEVAWSQDGRLWIPVLDGWDVYEAPSWTVSHVTFGVLNWKPLRWGLAPPASDTLVVRALTVVRKTPRNPFPATKFAVRRRGVVLHEAELVPRVPGGFRLALPETFSPDGSRLAITVQGEMWMDELGPGEIWVLDLESGKLRFLHEGKIVHREFEDPRDEKVQDVTPAWSPDSKSLAFGDDYFGIEEIDVATRKRRLILGPGSAGHEPRFSPTGNWIGFVRETPQGARLAVVSRDGKRWSMVSEEYAFPQIDAWNWHAADDTLAWVARKSPAEPFRLYVWRVASS